MNRSIRRQRRRGFTLLEVMLVLVIIVVITGLATVFLLPRRDVAFQNAAQSQLDSLKTTIRSYQLELNKLPPNLNALVEAPGDLPDPKKWRPFLEEAVPKDPWGNEYSFKVNGSSFELRCAGSDGQSNTDDDIVVEGK
jgi:general secretion pathway protein G